MLSGVTSAVDALTWSVCDDGEGIIIPRPLYSGFKLDVGNRANGVILPASFRDVEGYRGHEDVFNAGMNDKALEAAYVKGMRDGVVPKAVIIVK